MALAKKRDAELEERILRGAAEIRRLNPHLSELSRVEVVGALRRTGRLEGPHSSYVDAMKNAFDRHLALSDPGRHHPEYTLVPISSAVLLVVHPATLR